MSGGKSIKTRVRHEAALFIPSLGIASAIVAGLVYFIFAVLPFHVGGWLIKMALWSGNLIS